VPIFIAGIFIFYTFLCNKCKLKRNRQKLLILTSGAITDVMSIFYDNCAYDISTFI